MPDKVLAIDRAQARPEGLFLFVDGFWCQVDAKPAMLDVGLCILLDDDPSGTHFADTYTGQWPGDAADSSPPSEMAGGTNDPRVAALLERYTAMYPVMATVDLPVPAKAEAVEELPTLRAHRNAGMLVEA